MTPDRSPGWDKRCINAVAARDYGGLQRMFVAHGWSVGDRAISQIAPSRVVETYGSVDAFEAAHPAELPSPLEVIERRDPDVWLTSYYGFGPHRWGLLGFTKKWMRDDFLANSRPGALIVIYGASGAHDPYERMRILGIQQQSRILGHKYDFIPADRRVDEESNEDRRRRWTFALKACRAWSVTPETRPTVQEFAPVTYSHDAATIIGARGRKLTPAEARHILDLDLVEVPVYGGGPVDLQPLGPATDVLRPSKAGPVSSTGHWRTEAEGPKHLYVLKLNGNGDHFMGETIGDRAVVKVGMSRSPSIRRDDHNRALPKCAFEWTVARSTHEEGRGPFPSSRPALAGEEAMKDFLDREGRSLGGEFFLASPYQVEQAWRAGIAAAEGAQ